MQAEHPFATPCAKQRQFPKLLARRWREEPETGTRCFLRKTMDKGIEKHDITRPLTPHRAKGKPGEKPTWSSGAKTMVGTAASARSRIWFTVGNGTLNELYFPDVDQANTRSVRFLVSDGKSFFSDEQWDANHIVKWLAPGVPGCHIESKCKVGRYTIIKDIITDPVRDTLMMRVRFTAHQDGPAPRLYLFQEPQMGDHGEDNTAWIGQYEGKRTEQE